MSPWESIHDWPPGRTVELMQRLGGRDRAEDILRGKYTARLELVFPIWKTVVIGGPGNSPDKYIKRLKGKYSICSATGKVLPRQAALRHRTTVDLILVSVASLGFERGASLPKIYSSARNIGYRTCPSEVGPALRLAYNNQPMGDEVRIAMSPLHEPGIGNWPFIYTVHRDELGLHLIAKRAIETDWFGPDTKFVFC